MSVDDQHRSQPPADEPAPQNLTTPQLLTFPEPITTDQYGNIQLSGVLDVRDNKEVDMVIIQTPPTVPNMTVQVRMGAFATVNSLVGSFPLVYDIASPIRTFNVTGPQVNVTIFGGPPNTAVNVLGWVFVH